MLKNLILLLIFSSTPEKKSFPIELKICNKYVEEKKCLKYLGYIYWL